MRTGTGLFLALLLTFAPPALACSSHGSTAANNVNAWMNQQHVGSNSGDAGYSVTGDQANVEGNNDGENSGWAANDWYTVTITSPGNPSTSVTFTANPLDFDGGTELELWLEDAAKDWLIDHLPDQKLADFVG